MLQAAHCMVQSIALNCTLHICTKRFTVYNVHSTAINWKPHNILFTESRHHTQAMSLAKVLEAGAGELNGTKLSLAASFMWADPIFSLTLGLSYLHCPLHPKKGL